MQNKVSENTNIFQLNTHKSNISLSTLIDTKFVTNTNIALIQEPPQRKGVITGVPTPLSCLYSTSKPRAAIIHNPSLEVWQLPHLSDGDCQTAIWRVESCTPVIIVSAYWDITNPDIQPTLKKAIKETFKKKYNIIIAMDTNAHHPFWGSPKANARGELLASFLLENNLHILNNDNTPTFSRINCATHIDITVTNARFIPRIRKWCVLKEDMLSDHSCLQVTVGKTTIYQKCKLNLKKTNWEVYKEKLDQIEWSIIELINPVDIENATTYLTDNIINTLKDITPKTYITGKHRKDKWWNEDLRQMRRNLKVARNTPAYQALKTEYQKAIRKAKRESWNSFLEGCLLMSNASKFAHIITKPKPCAPGLTIQPDGNPTWSGIDSIKNIIQNLFPGSLPKPKEAPKQNITDGLPMDTTGWINTTTINAIISNLQPNKAPGPDEITGKMLKHLPLKVIAYLENLYSFITKISYIPEKWCKSKAIFIPKNNAVNKSIPKAFRPICLSNVLFKVYEKLIQNFLEMKQIYPHKLSHRQHGFRPNYSTLTALSSLIDYIETGFYHKQHIVAVFLDIHGAFDNIDPKRALKILDNWYTPKQITNTLRNYYDKREIITNISPTQKTLQFYPTKGTAQGNVLSPMLWNCVVNGVGDIMDNLNTGGCIFADDVVVAVRGNDLEQTHATVQQALNQITNWAIEEGLRFNVSKSHFMVFNPRGENVSIPILKINNDMLKQQKSTKYLGVLLDGSLKWNGHFGLVFDKAKREMMHINKALSKIIGPSPKLTHWIYTGIIRPKISYAAHIWCGQISNYMLEKKSRQIQRWALTKLGPIRANTPTAGLEIITKTVPLHIHLQEVSLKTIYNFKNINSPLVREYSPRGHIARWEAMLHKYIPSANVPCDKGQKVLAPNFRNRLLTPQMEDEVAVYTDGSKLGPDYGSGFLMKWRDQTRFGLSYNGQKYSVFLSEIRAISLALERLIWEKIPNTTINIYSDSQSAIAAILNAKTNSNVIQQCWSKLKQLDKTHKWSLSWVKAHVGLKGNEQADKLAKKGTQFKHAVSNIPIAPIHTINEITKFTYANWETYWNGRIDCRQTKLWFPAPNPKISKEIMQLNKMDFGLITRWFTGHCFLARHEALIHNEDPTCNLCFIDEQTPWHLLRECPATNRIRRNIPHDKWTTGIILKAIKNITYLEVFPETPANLTQN
jgi:ribonuclease HI